MIYPLAERLFGIIPPVITPLDEAGRFDRASGERLYRYHVDAGVHGLFLFGSSGEGPLLAQRTREEALETSVRVVAGRVPVLAGVLAAGTELAIAEARRAKELGADGLVVCPPFYFRVTQDELKQHFRAVRRAVDLPLLAYDIPATTKLKIELDTMLELACEGTLVGAKDSSGDAAGFRRLLVRRPQGFRLFTGSELLVDAVLLSGADGAVPGLANVAPELFVELYQHFTAGRAAEAIALQRRIVRLFDVFVAPDGTVRSGYAVGSMKAAMKLRGVIDCVRTCAPFEPVTAEQLGRVRAIMQETGVLR
ncbi:MAG: dihydrodipicolinate synthase family protein [Planctomycetes bacterium]|nr:dihydrodipicolinate synthase family protein [Planctomycetota bacterium]